MKPKTYPLLQSLYDAASIGNWQMACGCSFHYKCRCPVNDKCLRPMKWYNPLHLNVVMIHFLFLLSLYTPLNKKNTYTINIIWAVSWLLKNTSTLHHLDNFRVPHSSIWHLATGVYFPHQHTKCPYIRLWGESHKVEHLRSSPFYGELCTARAIILIVNNIPNGINNMGLYISSWQHPWTSLKSMIRSEVWLISYIVREEKDNILHLWR